GRIHRIGQKKDVFIYNLSAKGTIEARILELLDAKINMFQLVIGEMDMILGNLKERRDFEDIIMDIWTNVRDDEELSQRLDTFGNQLLEAKNRYSQVKNLGDNLLGELLPDDE
ncbi:MAG TPA: ATP-dependent helicase, partial [bacterium]|nr:ATP-dependent helicase [bacterium]